MKNILLIAGITALFFIVACKGDEGAIASINTTNTNANTGKGDYATRPEIPAITDNDIFITHTTTISGKENITYSIAHNPERKHSRWVAFTFDASNRAIAWKRDNWDNTEWGGDPFQPDPQIAEEFLFTQQEINRNGYVRGHLVASYDRVYSKDANEQTFYYSNISPMLSRFNTGKWNDLEQNVQSWGRNKEFCDTLYIVKGGTINEGYYKSVTNEQGITCKTVPAYYFMALLCKFNDTFKAIGFWFEHKSYLPGKLTEYAMTIDELEEKTGIDFFCNLNDKLETAVERQYNIKQWRGLD